MTMIEFLHQPSTLVALSTIVSVLLAAYCVWMLIDTFNNRP